MPQPLAVVVGIATPASYAAQRMWVWFHDDPSFRWSTERQALVAKSAQTNATIIRLLVQWNVVAKTRPANSADPFDPAYTFDDVRRALGRLQIVEDNLDECVLCELCLAAAPKGTVVVKKLYDGSELKS